MAKVLPALDDELTDWMGRQHVFFVATAPSEGGHVNVSPKGHDVLRVLDPHRVAYLDLTGRPGHPRKMGLVPGCARVPGDPASLNQHHRPLTAAR